MEALYPEYEKARQSRLPSLPNNDTGSRKVYSGEVLPSGDTLCHLPGNRRSVDISNEYTPHENDRNKNRSKSLDIGTLKRIPELPPANRHKDQVTVYIKIVFLKIGEIDTIKEHYSADIFIRARWREPSLDGTSNMDSEAVDWSTVWTPRINVRNVLGEPKCSIWHEIQTDGNGRVHVLEKRRLVGTFAENLELKEFPFDTQDLSVFVVSELSKSEVDLKEEVQEMSRVSDLSFADAQEWVLYDHIETIPLHTNKEYANTRRRHPGLIMLCRAARRPGFFLWNILLITALICTLSFCTFAVSKSLIQNRLQLSFTLVLTAVAFKFVLNQSLPKISYLTYLDVYVLISMILLYVVCVWHAVVSLVVDQAGVAAQMDLVAFIVLIVCYVICQVIFIAVIYFKAFRRRKEMKLKDLAYQEKAKRLEGSNYSLERRKSARYRNRVHIEF